jgi:hypothetical protein
MEVTQKGSVGMKNKLLAMLVLLVFLLGSPFSTLAKSSGTLSNVEQAGFIDVGANEATVTFAELGYRDSSLASPFDSTSVLFSIPPNWRLAPGGEVQLDYEVTLSGTDAGLITNNNPYGGTLSVTFNNQLVTTISLKEVGPQTMKFSLPPTALTSVRQDGRHQLTISLNAQFSCLYNVSAVVVIKSTSAFKLPFEVSAPELNLSRLPAPFYLRNALVPDHTLLVVPNTPDAKELQAALNVMSGFGSLVGEKFDFNLVPASELTNDTLAANNLIFVGRPDEFDMLSNIKLPLAIENKKFVSLPNESQADGILEMAISPWNDSKVTLLISGNSADAVYKAAQAASAGRVLIYENPALAYVADVQPLSDALPVVENFTLQSLGYKNETLSGLGLNSVQYLFNASKEQLNSKDSSIDLIYYHSGLLDYGYSSFSVELNNQVISSTAFTKETEQLSTLSVKIPPGILRFGENRLTVSARMLTVTSCDTTGFSDPWLTISDQSTLHLPASTDANASTPSLLDLKFFPNLFMTHSDLGDVAFVLPKSSPATWKIAGQMAYELGRNSNPLLSNLKAVYAEDVSQQVLGQNSLIVIGKSSTVPLISKINNQLPAPFDVATDTANESNMQVIYRIPKGMSVGYLELLDSPFNVEKPILVLAGNSDDGLVMAGNALLLNDLRNQLTGVFAVTNGTQIATGSASSVFSAVGTLVPPQASVITTPIPVSATAPAALAPPGWLMPLLVISGVAILLIIGWVLVSAFSRKREVAASTFNPANKSKSPAEAEENRKNK